MWWYSKSVFCVVISPVSRSGMCRYLRILLHNLHSLTWFYVYCFLLRKNESWKEKYSRTSTWATGYLLAQSSTTASVVFLLFLFLSIEFLLQVIQNHKKNISCKRKMKNKTACIYERVQMLTYVNCGKQWLCWNKNVWKYIAFWCMYMYGGKQRIDGR